MAKKYCEHCAYYEQDEIEEYFGLCELKETSVGADDDVCRMFVDKESEAE